MAAAPGKQPKKSLNKIKKLKFNKFSYKVLYNWLKKNKENPIPSRQALICLATKARLSEKQVINW